MKLALFGLVMIFLVSLGSANFIEMALKETENSDILQPNAQNIESENSQLLTNTLNSGQQKFIERDMKTSEDNGSEQQEDQFSKAYSNKQKKINFQSNLMKQKNNKLNQEQNPFMDAKKRLLDSDYKAQKQRQMKHSTIYIIIILTFITSIPIIKEVRSQNNLQNSRLQNKKIIHCKHIKNFKKLDLKLWKNIFPNFSGYKELAKASRIQS